jgi:hypothetical protein
MRTSVVVADWIQRIANDERERDAVRVREEEAVARKGALVRLNGRRLMDELRATVTRDIEAFREEFVGDRRRDIVLEATESGGGFTVRKPAPPAVALTVSPRPEAAIVACNYRFIPTNGLPPREHRFDLVFVEIEGEALQIKNHGTGQVFATADALSEFLLGPVFTGRPR